jgi:hypothetical protein
VVDLPPPARPGARSRTGIALAAGLVAWGAAVAFGLVQMSAFEAEPGAGARPPRHWPTGTPGLDAERLTLLAFAHPHCGCTRATLVELDRLLARCRQRLAARVVFYSDAALGEGWERTASWELAAAIPGVLVQADPLGAMARGFGALTSGTVLVYSPDGRLRFAGGITAARGHEGDSAGAAGIRALAGESTIGGPDAVARAEVYGCGLVAAEAAGR